MRQMEAAIEAIELPFDAVLCDLDGVIRFYDTVDDRVENIEAANELGMTTVLYRTVDDLRRALAELLNQ